MYFTEDEHFARQLQTELQAFDNFKRQKENTAKKENLNPVDSKLEYVDPTPSIHELFVKFDKKFFGGTLGMVQVLWSNKMTKCAGMCSFEGGKGLCKISLSAPLLSLRPRKDLVETLLHEMIHAYLFVTHNYKDREDHGPEFHKHMYRINKIAGTKITVYHTFYDEVEYYQRHIWRCNGPCQKKKPYFGFVKRAINRPPGPHDNWWNQHQKECQGIFIKISEPETKSNKPKKNIVVKKGGNKTIRDFFNNEKSLETNSKNQGDYKTSNIKTLANFKSSKLIDGIRTNTGTATVTITGTSKSRKSKTSLGNQNSAKESILGEKNPQNIEDSDNAKDLSASLSNVDQSKDPKEYFGKDFDNDKVRETVRNIWASKFSNSKSPHKNLPKKVKLECPVCDEGFSQEEIQNHVEKCLETCNNPEKDNKNPKSAISSSEKIDEVKICPVCSMDVFQSVMNDHLENCLSCSFPNDSNFNDEIVCKSVPCPCCYRWFQESVMNVHIDECLTLNLLKEEILAS